MFVFQWTRTVISQQYLDSIPLDVRNDRRDILENIATTAQVKVDWNSNGQIFLEGEWQHLMDIHVKLVQLRQEQTADASLDTLSSKTNCNTVVRYIKQKYLNASRRRSTNKKTLPPVEMPPGQENEVYVNITLSDGDLSKLTGLFSASPYESTVQQVTQLVPAELKEKKSPVRKKDYEKLAPYKFFCKICSFKSKRESHFQRHLELHNKVSELFSCSKCDFTTIRLGHLRRHELTHSDTSLKCDMCQYHTDHLKFLLRHQRIKHCNNENTTEKQVVLRCTTCDYSTTRPYYYKRHQQAHLSANSSLLNEEHRFRCQQCSYKTGRKEHFIRHVNNVHNNKRPYLCDHCGKAFKRLDALKQHRVTHVELDRNVEVVKCPVCNKCCRTQGQLTQHLAVHSNVRAFLCEICGSSFKTRAVQRKHVLTIHKNPKAFSCVQCSRKFNTKYALRRHMKQHCLDKKKKSCSLEEPVVELSKPSEPEQTLRVLMSEPILLQEAPQDNQKGITVQVIGYMQ